MDEGDFEAARGLVHDDLSFSGPIATFDNADGYVDDLRRLAPIVTGPSSTRFLSTVSMCASSTTW
jgi:hypothetical protein